MPSPSIVDRFRSALSGQVLLPHDPGYDRARRVFNTMIDRRPAIIAQCTNANDVIASVRLAREHDLSVAVRGGGHSVAGKSVCDDGLMIDLSRMKGVRVDASHKTVRAETGLTLGELDCETQVFGFATPLGIVSVTGIGGLTLGGGIGWLNGKHGLACDNVVSFEVVTADGALLSANADENDDLYWGLRGGSGNFGVVTAMHYRLHPVESVLAGPVFHPFDDAIGVLRFCREFAETVPDELSIMPALVTPPDGVPVAVVGVCYCGPLDAGEKALAPLRSFGRPLADAIQPMSWVAVQSMLDGFFPAGHQHYWKSNLTTRVPDEALEIMVDFMKRKPSPFTISALQHFHGAAARVRPEQTAFAHRGNRFDCLILAQWSDSAEAERNISWTREFYAAIEPHLDTAVYVNNLGEEPDAVIRAAFGANYDRLAALKRKYDPANFFWSTHNVKPSSRLTPALG